jgi:hypothetical protein
MSAPTPDPKAVLDRREFIAVAGAVAALSALPLQASAAVGGLAGRGAGLADWSIDDMWTGYPRPAETIGYGRRAPQQFASEHAREQADRQLLG